MLYQFARVDEIINLMRSLIVDMYRYVDHGRPQGDQAGAFVPPRIMLFSQLLVRFPIRNKLLKIGIPVDRNVPAVPQYFCYNHDLRYLPFAPLFIKSLCLKFS